MQAKEIKQQLNSLIEQSASIDPNLAKRLSEIDRWVKHIRLGSLTAKPIVLAFLLEVVTDATIWLQIKSLPSEEEQTARFRQMTANERYWYGYLFPRWFNSTDSRFYIWKKKMMSGEFNQLDNDTIRSIAQDIVRREGSFWHRYIADLSMATDLIVSNRQDKPLCIQVTSVSEVFHRQKYHDWQYVLQLWEIERGLFLSYNPRSTDFLNQLINVALYNSDHLTAGKYIRFS